MMHTSWPQSEAFHCVECIAVAQHAKDRVILLRGPTDLTKADKVLLVFTHGVLSGESLTQLEDLSQL